MNLQHYDQISTIGKGTQGSIVLVKHKELLEYFILKVLDKNSIFKKNSHQHIYNELEVLQVLRHQSIPRYLGHCQDDSAFYQLFDYVRGISLESYLAQTKQLSLSHSAFYAYQCILILNYLHSHHIVHRDIKPGNLMIDHLGFIQLIDFGFSKKLQSDSSRTYTFCGTPHYMAPETVLHKGQGLKADYWSLGVVLYEMLTSQVPFDSNDPFEIYQQIQFKEIHFHKHIDKFARKAICSLTTKDETKRGLLQLHDKIFNKLDKDGILNKTAVAPYIPQ